MIDRAGRQQSHEKAWACGMPSCRSAQIGASNPLQSVPTRMVVVLHGGGKPPQRCRRAFPWRSRRKPALASSIAERMFGPHASNLLAMAWGNWNATDMMRVLGSYASGKTTVVLRIRPVSLDILGTGGSKGQEGGGREGKHFESVKQVTF